MWKLWRKASLILPTKGGAGLGPELGLDGHMSADTQVHTQRPEERLTRGCFSGGTHPGSCQLHLSPPTGKHGLDGSRGSLHLPGAQGRQFTVFPVSRAAPGGSAAAVGSYELGTAEGNVRAWDAHLELRVFVSCMWLHRTLPLWTHPHKLLWTVGGPGLRRLRRQLKEFLKTININSWKTGRTILKEEELCNHSSLLKMSC